LSKGVNIPRRVSDFSAPISFKDLIADSTQTLSNAITASDRFGVVFLANLLSRSENNTGRIAKMLHFVMQI